MKQIFFSSLHDELITRSSRAITSLLGIANAPLRKFLCNTLKQPNALLADPVFEPTFGWAECNVVMGDLPPALVHPRLLKALANPPEKLSKDPEDYRFPTDRHPFVHQKAAWDILVNPPTQSLVVTSGTGSGKTECFLIPILNRLAHQVDAENGMLEGVRALFIYPLNALISSQKNRLDAWTDGFDGDIRYCLYTGNLDETAKAATRQYKGEVLDRKSLRASAPPLLITNATMLEYMLVRKEDTPILEKSQGKLEWIVLDEAHSYIGSQAAEMAMLLRRVMIAFGVKPENVRFVATSATFGADVETSNKLKEFLAHMAGIQPEQVSVVHGKRYVPTLTCPPAGRQISLEELCAIDSENECSDVRFHALCKSQIAVGLRSAFLANDGGCRPQRLSLLSSQIGGNDPQTTLRWLDLLTSTRNADKQSFLPLRKHVFHNVFSRLAACVNSACSEKNGLDDAEQKWQFGMVYMDDRDKCPCGAPVLPIAYCQECREPGLLGVQSPEFKLEPKERDSDDEFSLEQDVVDSDDEEGSTSFSVKKDLLIINRHQNGATVDTAWLDIESHRMSDIPVAEREGVTLALVDLANGEQNCPSCGSRFKYRKMTVGTPFVLSTAISTLLEYCPDDAELPAEKPARGRKMISFTDSRQGTARIAVKLQQDSERAKVRGLIYHKLLSSRKNNTLSEEETADYEELLREQQAGQLKKSRDLNYLNSLIEKRGDGGHTPLSWDALKRYLAENRTISQSIFDYYRSLAPSALPPSVGPGKLAEIFLFREFARRPKTQNSLESMGFIALHYPQLKQVTTTPAGWKLDVDSWRDYLKVLLDFYVRENSFIEIPKDYLNLIGIKIAPKWLRPPTSNEENSNRIKKWPQYVSGSSNPRLQSRPIVLLQNAFGWEGDGYRDNINLILLAAWRDLVDVTKLLKPSEDGFRLHLADVEFSLITKAGICPITRRFLDTCFAGYSPYTFPSNRKELHQCKLVQEMPIYPHAFGNVEDADKSLGMARQWLNQNEIVIKLRDDGLWSDLHDRVIEGGVFYRAAEHSAQQPQYLLQRFERDFKQGKLNLMSCSTTMEMGVDIGGITVVAMNNVPPHPANYLQRAGRAGRRRESRAIAATVCKNTPHDQSVFKNPLWAFEKNIPMPIVSLQSPELVQRHINAYLLSTWVRLIIKDDEIRKTTCGSFFLSKNSEYSVANRFVMWCRNGIKNLESIPEMRSQFSALLRHTPYEGVRAERLFEVCGEAMSVVAADWLKVFNGIQQQLDDFGSEETPARKAMTIQLNRVQGEYLLSELATRRFLPGYGFPTDIVCFDNYCISTLKSDDAGLGKEREDNRMRSKSLASRDRATALREYAPGSEIVMNGLVYRSGGITLNWHVPASEDQMKEAQLFKTAWRCKSCGASGSVIGNAPDVCECCGSELGRSSEERISYLVPSGFAVDFFADPHTDISSPIYIPVKQPWLSLSEPWCGLVNPALGVFRTSSRAHLYHYTGGQSDAGFAICLECGRAEPMLTSANPDADVNEEYLPKIFHKRNTHFRLRGGKGKEGKAICPGSEDAWKIKQNVFLGHDTETDAFEILLLAQETQKWLVDDVIAYTLAVAIRSVLAQTLGIIEEELGCSTREIRFDNQVARAIQVYDLRSGGYSSLARYHVNSRAFWLAVFNVLDCPNGCAASCLHCLQSFDNRFAVDRLNRTAAQRWINEDWLNRLTLPENLQIFGPNSIVESEDILQAISKACVKPSSKLRIYLHGSPSDWALPSATLLRGVVKVILAGTGRLELVAAKSSLQKMDAPTRHVLASMVDFGAIYAEADQASMSMSNGAMLIASVNGEAELGWCLAKGLSMLPDATWGYVPDGDFIIRGVPDFPSVEIISVDDIRPPGGGVTRIEVGRELSGDTLGFGARFWSLLLNKATAMKQVLEQKDDPLVEICYSDRYINNPIALKLLVEVVAFLKKLPCGDNQFPSVKILVRSYRRMDVRDPFLIWHDWRESDERNKVLSEMLEYCGFTAEVQDKSILAHGRVMELKFESGKCFLIQLDQGFSYWRVDEQEHKSKFRWWFDLSPKEQSEKLISANLAVMDSCKDDMTQIYISQK